MLGKQLINNAATDLVKLILHFCRACGDEQLTPRSHTAVQARKNKNLLQQKHLALCSLNSSETEPGLSALVRNSSK